MLKGVRDEANHTRGARATWETSHKSSMREAPERLPNRGGPPAKCEQEGADSASKRSDVNGMAVPARGGGLWSRQGRRDSGRRPTHSSSTPNLTQVKEHQRNENINEDVSNASMDCRSSGSKQGVRAARRRTSRWAMRRTTTRVPRTRRAKLRRHEAHEISPKSSDLSALISGGRASAKDIDVYAP